MTYVNGPLGYDNEKEVSAPMTTPTFAQHARGDKPSSAARSLRNLLIQRRQYDITRNTLFALFVVLAVAAVAGVVGMAVTQDPGFIVITIFAAVLAMLGRYVADTHGASVMIGSGVLAIGFTVWTGITTELSWLTTVVSCAAILAVLQQLASRNARLPVMPVGVVSQWSVALAAFVAQWVGSWIVAVAVVVVLAVTIYQCDITGYINYRRACRRSGIPAKRTGVGKRTVGLHVSAMMTRENIGAGIEAEQATAEVLDTLGPEYVVLHSRAIPGSNADIDHLVVGPHGVALIDSKYRTGEMELRERIAGASPEIRDEAAGDAVAEAMDLSSPDVPDEHLDGDALRARHKAYEACVASVHGEEPWDEWFLNGAPANAALVSSASWETSKVEEALLVPQDGQASLPCVLSIYGARMSDEMAVVPAFNHDGSLARAVTTAQYTAVADYIRGLPVKITNPQMITDLATVVGYLFPRK